MSSQQAPSSPSRAEWLEWRRQGLGGSDAAAIAGLDPYRSPIQVWLDKTGQLPLDERASEAALWGHLLEPIIADEFERRREVHVLGRQTQIVHPTTAWLRATLDGLIYEVPGTALGPGDEPVAVMEIRQSGGPVALYEGKTTSSISYSLDWGEEPPDRVILQVQHNLAASQLAYAWVTCLVGGQRLRIFEVERDDDLIGELLDLEQRFWERHVLAGDPPPVVGTEREGQALRAAYLDSDPRACVDLDEDGLNLIRNRQAAKAEEKAAKKRIDAAENELMLLLGEAEAGLYDGREVVTFRRVETKTLDRERLMHAHPNLYQRFIQPSAYRRFYVPKNALGDSNGEGNGT